MNQVLKPDVSTSNDNSMDTVTSSKLSTDQLIIKSSPEPSLKKVVLQNEDDGGLLVLGTLQFAFGFLMVVFGGLVLHYDASLSQLGAGIWSGCLSMGTGIIGILASAREFQSTSQKITHTIFLALSLISLAIAQLVVALAATGTVRDVNNSEYGIEENQTSTTTISPGQISIVLPLNYMSILCNVCLLITSACEFVIAAIASYRSSRILCPCFRKNPKLFDEISTQKNALVNTWLGRQNSTPVYVVAASTTSTIKKGSCKGMPVPVFTVPSPMVHSLIPAPLGSIPSPVIPPLRKKKHIYAKCPPKESRKKRCINTNKKKRLTEADMVQTYTGLDKAIAEEFIDKCDSLRHASLSSDSSCNSSCHRSCSNCQSSTSEEISRDYIVDSNKVSEL